MGQNSGCRGDGCFAQLPLLRNMPAHNPEQAAPSTTAPRRLASYDWVKGGHLTQQATIHWLTNSQSDASS